MKTIGLIGGLSWESTVDYYRYINLALRARLGGAHSAPILLYSVDFAPISQMQRESRWDDAADEMIAAAQRLERGGADCVLICANTMHKMADAVQSAVSIPLLHIADAAAAAIRAQGLHTVGLLGTRYTMEMDFYTRRLEEQHGITAIVPDAPNRDLVHRVIYEELTYGVVKPESKAAYLDVMARLVGQGAQGIILGCTEIGMLITQDDTAIPVFDTTKLHAEAAVAFALEEVMVGD